MLNDVDLKIEHVATSGMLVVNLTNKFAGVRALQPQFRPLAADTSKDHATIELEQEATDDS